ncbi:MAG: cytochrome c/FTR1 family iron permease [Gemmatimonadota bacterium]
MVLISGIALVASLLAAQQPSQGDPSPLVRRIAATARLATQEYSLGVHAGRVVAPEEVEEARLFLTEARRSAALLPPEAGRPVLRQIDAILDLVNAVALPDSIIAQVSALSSSLAQKFGITLDEMPSGPPSLARGAELFQQNCASCHGVLGRGDGPAARGMNPPPANLSDAATQRAVLPLDYYQRVTIGVTGTAMPAFESRLSSDDRWAVTAYATLLRLPAPSGDVPSALRSFATTARMSDSVLAAALVPGEPSGSPLAMSRVAAVRNYQAVDTSRDASNMVFAQVRSQVDSSLRLAERGEHDEASTVAFDAYMTFEQVESQIRAKDNRLAGELEAIFAELRTRAAGGATRQELRAIQSRLLASLETAERKQGDRLSAPNLFFNSFVILLREGLEAILILGALVTMLAKLGAGHRKRDVHIGAAAAVGASLITAAMLQTLVHVTPNRQEALEGFTMLVAVVMLFYVSYWLLSRMEVAKWNRFVRGKVEDALTSGSALALASVAFLAVYREGFETVLFYKALFVASGSATAAMPVLGGILAGSVVLLIVYYAINRFGVKIPLKPFFAVTSGFLYYMAFVFAGKGIAELQEGGLVSLTPVEWAPRVPAMGIYQTMETLAAQGILLALFLFALLWTFVIEPRRLKVTSEMVPDPVKRVPEARSTGADVDRDMIRSLERMDADLAELRAEVERLKQKLTSSTRK